MRRLLSLLAAFLCAVTPSFADTLTTPYSFSPGDAVTASKFNSNFTAISSIINGSLDDNNIKVAAGIQLSKLAATSELFVLRTAANRCLSAGVTGDTVPRITLDSSGRLFFGAGSASAQDIMIKRNSSTQLSIRNAADSADANLSAGALTLGTALPVASGGTGLSSIGANGSYLGVSAGALAYLSSPSTVSFTYSSKTSNFTAAAQNAYGVDTSGGAVTCTLPTAVSIAGQEIVVSLRTAGNNLTFNTTSSQTIDGQASGAIVTGVRYNTYRFMSDGANWVME